MIIELQIFKYRVVLTAAKTEVLEGVYSLLDNDNHFLMWDFDDTSVRLVKKSLLSVQELFKLPKIYVMETQRGEGYHAYCLCHVSFKRACEILAATECIDMRFYTAGVMRHKWTLRISAKSGRVIQPIDALESPYQETIEIEDIKHFCHYKAPGDGHKTTIITLGGQ